jgi:hypothetical protein
MSTGRKGCASFAFVETESRSAIPILDHPIPTTFRLRSTFKTFQWGSRAVGTANTS